MRSRDIKPFAIEIRTKKRSPSGQSPSIWGDSAGLLKEASAPSRASPPDRQPSARSQDAPLVVQAVPAERRILQDLRPSDVPDPTPVVETREPRRQRRKTIDGTASTAARKPEASRSPKSVTYNVDVQHDESGSAVRSALRLIDYPIVKAEVPQAAPPRLRSREPRRLPKKWARQLSDLPRGERWRRRLPAVCR
jgi:hypothetical protein